MKKDKAIFNWVLFLSLIVAPVLGMLFVSAPDGVEGTDALYFTAAIGFGWGLVFGVIFSVLWFVKKIFSR